MSTYPSLAQSVPNSENVTRAVLDNGMTLLVRENHAAPVAVMEGYLPAGAIHDPGDKAGVGQFVASMLMRGSSRFSFDDFNQTIENVGASLSVSAGTHSTDFGSTSLSEDFPRMVEVLADILRQPTFPAEHITRVRKQKLVHIQERDNDTQQVAGLRFYETIYGDHPYGLSNTGYAETVSTIQREDLLAFHAQRFTPNGAALVVAGDVDTENVIDLLSSHFGDWKGPVADQSVPAIQAQTEVQRLSFPLLDKMQSDIVVGCQAVARSHPDYYAIRVANTVLGRFGMMGRLGENVREEQGLAYHVYSAQDASLAGGVWLAAAAVNPADVELAIDSILAEFDRLGSEPVSDTELADSQAFLTGVVPLTLETNEGVATTLLSMEWYGLGLDYLLQYNDLIYRITPADLQRVAQEYLRTDGYTLVMAGPIDGST